MYSKACAMARRPSGHCVSSRRSARQAWAQPADAVALGTPAIQAGLAPGLKTGGRSAGDPPAPGEPGTGEDCLFLNVWTPGLALASGR